MSVWRLEHHVLCYETWSYSIKGKSWNLILTTVPVTANVTLVCGDGKHIAAHKDSVSVEHSPILEEFHFWKPAPTTVELSIFKNGFNEFRILCKEHPNCQ